MALFLNKTGRPIALSCEYAVYQRGVFVQVGDNFTSFSFSTNIVLFNIVFLIFLKLSVVLFKAFFTVVMCILNER